MGFLARWYMKLDHNQIYTWTDLMKAFLAEYDHVIDIAPDRMALMTMEKKEMKSFKKYAHRWQDVTSQVQPPFTEKETTFIFVNTLPEPYYEKMIGNAMRNFAEMVWSRKLNENGIKNKKIKGKATLTPIVNKSTLPKKKEGDTHVVFINHQSKG